MKRLARLLLACGCLGGCATDGIDPGAATTEEVQNAAIVGLGARLIEANRSDIVTLGLAYLIYDPMAPNWSIEETRVSENVFHLQLRMKRYHTGGAGESMLILKRRAGQLQRQLGYAGYRILDYNEGIDSNTMAAQRYGEGSIQLVRR